MRCPDSFQSGRKFADTVSGFKKAPGHHRPGAFLSPIRR